MMHNPVPLGFIYVQLPNQNSPQEIWPWMIWTDDSKQYDSTFFRVAGSKAEAFGKVQEDFSPYIDEIWSPCVANNVCGDWEPYRDKKCIKLINNKNSLQSFDEAEKSCASNENSNLISINNQDEHRF
ncbi:hypothetical protein TYRP_020356 [Tyrophagus putrescentiae]|nr:hypothetical protein TYRP_020356 [Tyrophagus putrescentiae]